MYCRALVSIGLRGMTARRMPRISMHSTVLILESMVINVLSDPVNLIRPKKKTSASRNVIIVGFRTTFFRRMYLRSRVMMAEPSVHIIRFMAMKKADANATASG